MNLLYLWEVCDTFDLTRSCMQKLEDSVVAGDGGSRVPLLFDNHTNADFMQGGDDGLFMGSSKGSKFGSRASNSDTRQFPQLRET